MSLISPHTAAIICAVLTGIVVLFQVALAAGMPWGAASMGGKFPGKYPPKMRIIACVNILVLLFTLCIVLVRAGWMLSAYKPLSETAIWFVVAFFALGTVLNTITPSKIERIWAPVALIQMIACLLVAMSHN